MDAPQEPFRSSLERTRSGPWWWRALGQLGSVRAAAALIALIAVVIAAATVYERSYGSAIALRMVYETWWFAAIFLVLGGCIAAAAIVRLPWKRRHLGFVTVHCGLLLLIAGFLLGHGRIDGMLVCPPGQPAHEIETHDDHLSVADGNRSWKLTFDPRPDLGYPSLGRYLLHPLWRVPQPGLETIDRPLLVGLGEDAQPAVRVSLLGGIDCAAAEPGRMPGAGGAPALRMTLTAGPPGQEPALVEDRWLGPEDPFANVGMARTSFVTARTPGLDPGPAEAPAQPRLRIGWHGQVHTLELTADAFNREHAIADDLALAPVRLIARPRFTATGAEDDPAADVDPVLELRIGSGPAASRSWSLRRISGYLLFADGDGPELRLDHPLQFAPQPGRQGLFVQAVGRADGSLAARWFVRSRGLAGTASAPAGSPLDADLLGTQAAMRMQARLTHIPSAVAAPVPQPMLPGKQRDATRWLLLGLRRGEAGGQLWIARGTRAEAALSDGTRLMLHYAPAAIDLKQQYGFAIRLERFEEGVNPGGMGSASFASRVSVVREGRPDEPAHITMNEPLVADGVTLYQTSYIAERGDDGRPTGRHISVFTAATDPGLWLKYLGSLLLCLGTALWYLLRK